MPEIGKKEAWIALDQDDKPLAERGGGLRLIVPGEEMPGEEYSQPGEYCGGGSFAIGESLSLQHKPTGAIIKGAAFHRLI